MGACSTEEKNDVTTKKGLAAPHKALGLPHKPGPLFPVEWTPDAMAIAISREREASPFQIV